MTSKESQYKTLIKGTGFSSFSLGGHMAAVDVKDSRIIRIRNFHYDWKYKAEEVTPWRIEVRGKNLHPPLKSALGPFGLAYKKRIYSPNRILYPLKRVDWNPNGERNPQNRGKSKYVRISWDEALDIIVSEIRRIQKQYGPEAIYLQGEGHSETKAVHGPHGCFNRLFDQLGGYTLQLRNPDSWEGWYWGTKHVWSGEPFGMMPNPTNLLYDIAQHSGMILFWGCDPTTTTRGFNGGDTVSLVCYWLQELGIKQVYVCPDLNYGAAVFADKWIPVLPGTDAALHLGIAYTWITEGNYDKEYVSTHTVGFDKFRDYVLGKEDGIAKTPKWAEAKCGVSSRTIKALARFWGKTVTSIMHCLGGPYIRGPYSHEPARLEATLLAMQGLGKPGTHQFCTHNKGSFGSQDHPEYPPHPGGVISNPPVNIFGAYRGYNPFPYIGLPKQVIPKTILHDAILKGSFTIRGSSLQSTPAEEQFIRYDYPAKGCSPIHMMWADTPCLMTCWNDSNRNAEAYNHESIEFVLIQHPWMENDCHFADILLPANTKFEENDIGVDTESWNCDTIFLEEQCIEPIGESMSDYDIVCAVAERMGLLEKYTEGKSVDDWIRNGFDKSGVPERGLISWEEFKEKKYYVVPTDPDWKSRPAGMYHFYQDPEKNPLPTPTGKLEIYSQRLAGEFPDDEERPPIPKWIEKSESHDERIAGERAKDYPLLCMSNHPRWRMHAQLDDVTWFHEIETGKVIGPDGYHYEPAWIHPSTAEERCIRSGDIIDVYNERGHVLCGAYVTERIMPAVVYVDHGARYDPIVPGVIDRGGAINTITPHNTTSKNCAGMVTSGFLVECAVADLDGLRRDFPEAFSRPSHYGSEQKFERVLDHPYYRL